MPGGGRYGLREGFWRILEVLKAWVDTAVKNPQTLHHRGNGVFAVAGAPVRLRSGMK